MVTQRVAEAESRLVYRRPLSRTPTEMAAVPMHDAKLLVSAGEASLLESTNSSLHVAHEHAFLVAFLVGGRFDASEASFYCKAFSGVTR